MAFATVCVCLLRVRALKGKRLELSTPNSVGIQCTSVAQHALTLRSKGQRSKVKCVAGVGVQVDDCLGFLVGYSNRSDLQLESSGNDLRDGVSSHAGRKTMSATGRRHDDRIL